MKIINEKGKLFGIINIIDLLVLLFILMIIGGVAWKIFGNQLEVITSPTTEVTYTVRIRGTFPNLYDAASNKEFPQQLVTSSGAVADAYLQEIESTPYITQVVTDDGRIVDAVDSTKIDIICTVNAKINNADILKIGPQELQIGKGHIVKTKYFEMNGTIETLDLGGGK